MAGNAPKRKAGRPPKTAAKVIKADTPRQGIERFIRDNLRGGVPEFARKLLLDIEKVENDAIRVKLKLEFLNYLWPKLKATEVTGNVDVNQPINIVFAPAGQPERIEASPTTAIAAAIVEAEIQDDDDG